MVTLASGTRVSLAYVRERVRGTTPAGVGTAVDTVQSVAVGAAGAGYSTFVRPSGSWITDGFYPGQTVTSSGFADADTNGNWVVYSVSATDLQVIDADDDIVDEAGDVAQEVVIRMETLRATGRNINLEKNILESAEVRVTRQKSDVRHGFNRVTGTPGWEWSVGAYDDMIELVMGSAWYTVAVTGSPGIGSHSDGKFVRDAGSFITDGFRAGDVIRTGSFVATPNNGDWIVTAVAALELTVYDPNDLITTVAAPAGGATLVLPGKRIDIGTTLATVTMERQFGDVGKYEPFLGVALDQMDFGVQPEAIVGGSLNLLGMIASAMASSSISSSAVLAAATNSPFAAFDGLIFEGGSLIGVATSLEGTLANARSLNPVIGSRFSPDVFEGTAVFNGTLMAYFQDEVLRNKFVNETESSIWTKLVDPNAATSFMQIVMPRVKYTGGSMDPPQEGPVPLEMPFQALEQAGLYMPSGATAASCLTIQRSNS